MSDDDPRPILNLADAPTHTGAHGEHFAYSMSELASALDSRAIGANVTRVPPGKAAFPFHHHHANEEHFFVLSGRGVLRVGERTYPVQPHDYIVHPPGGPETAHQLINDGDEDLVYLALSTRLLPEVVGYPDSNKTGVRVAAAGQAPGAR
ncbi:MAG TPA: cupin domain-containing protein, partial [Steroidobacteraceae bacterium]|nr:cupin domain-containing protein [Steroidobacteraceae bacterium]